MTENAYGLWSLVLINSALFIFFAFPLLQAAEAGATGAPGHVLGLRL